MQFELAREAGLDAGLSRRLLITELRCSREILISLELNLCLSFVERLRRSTINGTREGLCRIALITNARACARRFRLLRVAFEGTGRRVIRRETMRAVRDLLLLIFCDVVLLVGNGVSLDVDGVRFG